MKFTIILLLSFLFNFSQSAKAQNCDSIQSLRWVLGYWVANHGENAIVESWKELSLLTFEGFGETRSKTSNNLQDSESLRLVQMSGEIFYIAKVQHNAVPAAFKLIECSNQAAIFENPDHDFPKKIEYRLDNDNELSVIVSDGADKHFKINFVKRDDS